jgi:hypothetical protein
MDGLFSMQALIWVAVLLPALAALYWSLRSTDFQGNFDA